MKKQNIYSFLVIIGFIFASCNLRSITNNPVYLIQTEPESSSYMDLSLSAASDFQNDRLTLFLENLLDKYGAIPASPSNVKNTLYALETLKLLDELDLINNATSASFILDHLSIDGGFSDVDELNASISTSYNAYRALQLVSDSISSEIQQNLGAFINSTLRNSTFFSNNTWSNDTSPEIINQAISLLDLITPGIFNLDNIGLFEYLLSNYYRSKISSMNFGLVDDIIGNNKFSYSYSTLSALNDLGLLNETRLNMTNQRVMIEQGLLVSGNNDSICLADANSLKVNGSTGIINLTISIPMLLQLSSYSDVIGTMLKYNFSYAVPSINASMNISIFNANASKWESIAAYSNLTGSPAFAQMFLITPELNLTNYTTCGEETAADEIRLNILLNETTGQPFQINVDQFQYNYTVFNASLLLSRACQCFDGQKFDERYLRENYYAVKILEFFNASGALNTTEKNALANFTLLFKTPDGLFGLDRGNLKSSLEASFYATYLLHYTGNLTTTLNTDLKDYIIHWQFPDGGFGSKSQLSLRSTYWGVKLVNDAGLLNASIENKVKEYIESCQLNSSLLFYDHQTSMYVLEDTYYAFKTYECLSSPSLVPNRIGIANLIIANQNPFGCFFTSNSLLDTFYGSEILYMLGRTNDLVYLDELKEYVRDCQVYYGGFQENEFQTTATVEATCRGLIIAAHGDFLADIRVEDDVLRGALTYLQNHQNITIGGPGSFYEENLPVQESLPVDLSAIYTTFVACDALNITSRLYRVETTRIYDFLMSMLPFFNNAAALDGPERPIYFDTTLARIYFTQIHEILQQGSLQVKVFVDRTTTVPNMDVEAYIDVSSPLGRLIEGATITCGGTTFTDNQNGTYTGFIQAFNTTGIHDVIVNVTHPKYLSYVRSYALPIMNPVELRLVNLVNGTNYRWLASQLDIAVDVVARNGSTSSHVSNCTVSVLLSSGHMIGNLSETMAEGQQNGYQGIVGVPGSGYRTINFIIEANSNEYASDKVLVTVVFVPPEFAVVSASIIGAAVAGFVLITLRTYKKTTGISIFRAMELKRLEKGTKEKKITASYEEYVPQSTKPAKGGSRVDKSPGEKTGPGKEPEKQGGGES